MFSGTSDGRKLCEMLAEGGHDVTACVATEYGASLCKGVRIHCGRLDADEMAEYIKSSETVIDATHPYAAEATRNIRYACEKTGIRYIRLLRECTPYDGCICVSDIKSAVNCLKETEGRIFVSTGSKELSEFECIGERVRARVLDTDKVRERCRKMNISEIIYSIPPYSTEDNIRHFKDCAWLVTKDSGAAGATAEKLEAARHLGIRVIMISRPQESCDAYSMEEIKNMFL